MTNLDVLIITESFLPKTKCYSFEKTVIHRYPSNYSMQLMELPVRYKRSKKTSSAMTAQKDVQCIINIAPLTQPPAALNLVVQATIPPLPESGIPASAPGALIAPKCVPLASTTCGSGVLL
jgi:hypothetical protein